MASPLFSILPLQSKPNQTYWEYAYPQTLEPQSFKEFINVLPPPLLLDKPLSGPLMTSVVAIFGNNTFFETIASHSNFSDPDGVLCRQLRQPFKGLGQVNPSLWSSTLFNAPWDVIPVCQQLPHQTSNSSLLLNTLLDWLPNFGNTYAATAALTLSTYSANTETLKGKNASLTS